MNAPQPSVSHQQLFSLAQTLAREGKIDQAADALLAIIGADASNTAAMDMFYQLAAGANGTVCCERLERLITAYPKRLDLRAVAAGVYRALGRRKEELAHLKVLDKRDVRAEDFCLQYAAALAYDGQIDRAIEMCNKGLALNPRSADLLKQRAALFIAQGKPERALRDFEECVAIAPGDYHARVRAGSVKLLLSDCREGYADFGAHLDLEIRAHGFAFPMPEWKGEPLAGKHVLIWASQGIGDVVMFAAFVPCLLAVGAKVTLAVYPKLAALFARSFPAADVVTLSKDVGARYAHCDYHLPFGQLMAQVLPHYEPARHPAFLMADASRVDALRARYSTMFPSKKFVGIAWHTTNPDTGTQRSIPLTECKDLFAVKGVQFVSLQYGNHAAEMAAAPALYSDHAIDAYEDIDGLAAQIAAMDEVLAIDNSTAHLAGALGVPTTLLLSAPSDWRWGLSGERCRWYGSLRIERQEKLFRWHGVLQRVQEKFSQSAHF